MKVQKIKLNANDYCWLVLDNNHLPVKPITDFIRYLNNVDKSPFTIRSYAYHLKKKYLALIYFLFPVVPPQPQDSCWVALTLF